MKGRATLPRLGASARRQAAIGVVLVVAAVVGLYSGSGARPPVPTRLIHWLRGDVLRVTIVFAGAVPLRAGDPLYRTTQNRLIQVGEVVNSQTRGGQTVVVARIFRDVEPELRYFRFTLFGPDETVRWAIAALWSPARRAAARAAFAAYWAEVRDDVQSSLWPAMRRLTAELVPLVMRSLDSELRRQRPRLEKLTAPHLRRLEVEAVPLFRRRALPLIEREASPVVTRIVNKLIDRFPTSKAGWSFIKDKLPWGRDDHLKRLLQKFVEKEVEPTLRAHRDELIVVAKSIASKLAADPVVRVWVAKVGTRLLDDKELRALVESLVLDATVRNAKLRASVLRFLADPQLVQLAERLVRGFEPTLKRLLSLFLLDPRGEAIDPHVAMLLRSRLLQKDRLWIRLEHETRRDPLPARFTGVLYGR